MINLQTLVSTVFLITCRTHEEAEEKGMEYKREGMREGRREKERMIEKQGRYVHVGREEGGRYLYI